MRSFLLYTIVLLILIITGLSFLSLSGCGDMSQESKASPVYKAEIDSWQVKRIMDIINKKQTIMSRGK